MRDSRRPPDRKTDRPSEGRNRFRSALAVPSLALALSAGAACKSGPSAEDTAIASLREAILTAQKGDLDGADSLARRALEERPGFVDPCFALAAIAEKRGDLEAARGWYLKALELDPTRTPAGTALAQTYLREGRFDEGRTWLQRSLEADPGAEAAIFNLGSLSDQQGDPDGAAGYYRISAAIEPGDPRAPTAIARLRLKQGRVKEAQLAATEALRRVPGYPPAAAILAAASR